MKTQTLLLVATTLTAATLHAEPPAPAVWKKQTVTTDFLTEGLSTGDIDGDGKLDLVAGAFWFKGPEFSKRFQYRPGEAKPPTVYMEDSFLSWVEDFNHDGKNDILMVSHPGKDLTLYINPGKPGDWQALRVMTEAANESPSWTDLDGDGKGEMVCMQGGKFGYGAPDWSDVTKPWSFVAISDKRADTPYVHGLGVGDLNGDGRKDVIEKDGWFEQPAAKDGTWTWHKESFGGAGGAQMLVFDADGDGDNDVMTSLSAHSYGLSWFENRRNSGDEGFQPHEILPEDPAKKGVNDFQFSELHALVAGDLDKDGRMDFITGKRYFAHNEHDPGALEPAVAVVFYNRKEGTGVRWEPQEIDNNSGVGTQVQAVDLNGDGKLEYAVGNKKGVYIFSH